jgi:hypothetical protein
MTPDQSPQLGLPLYEKPLIVGVSTSSQLFTFLKTSSTLFPLWMAGLLWLFFGHEGRKYRVLGWAFVVTFAIIAALHGKDWNGKVLTAEKARRRRR